MIAELGQQVNGNSLGVGGIRLNLGGLGEGFLDSSIPGFKTVDLRPGADYQRDVSDLSIFGDNSVDVLYASNVLEHFPIARMVPVLMEWRRVLKPRGKLYVSVPDFDATVRLYGKLGLTEWIKYHLWGDQKHPLNYHYICFTGATLSKDLIDAGFSELRRVKNFNIGERDGSRNINTINGELISVNMVATK